MKISCYPNLFSFICSSLLYKNFKIIGKKVKNKKGNTKKEENKEQRVLTKLPNMVYTGTNKSN